MKGFESGIGFCDSGDCKALQQVFEDVEAQYEHGGTRRAEKVESNVIADCLLMDSCAAKAYTAGTFELPVFIEKAGKLAARHRRSSQNA